MAATSTAAKSNTDKADRIQNQAMRIMTGAMRSTPVTTLETVTGLQTLDNRRNNKVLSQAAKFKRLPDHPMHERLNNPTKGRLKRSSFIHQSRLLERRDPELLDHEVRKILPYTVTPSWERHKLPTITKTIPGIISKDSQSDIARRSLTLDYIHTNFPENEWTHAFTDGSATEATRDGGGGVYIKFREEELHISIPTGKYSTNFRAEATALKTAATEIRKNIHKGHRKVAIFSDALSVLDALQNPRKRELNELLLSLTQLSSEAEVTLQWIPAHCGVHGNETADALAKEGGRLDQEDKSVTYQDEKTIIKSIINKKWRQTHPDFNPSDSLHRLSRADQVILLRLRTGHNRLNAHLFRLKIGQTDMCPCDTAPMTSPHLLQECPLHDVIRRETWPEETPLRDKLHGDVLALQRTADFIRATGVAV